MQFGFSAHGIKSGRLEGVLGSIMQLFDSPALSGGIKMTCCKIVSCWLMLSFSASLYCWHFPHVLNLFFSCVFFQHSLFHWCSNTGHLVVGLQSKEQLDIKSAITYQVPVNPFLTSGTFTRGKITHLSGKCFHMDTKSGAHSCGNESKSFNQRDIINKW